MKPLFNKLVLVLSVLSSLLAEHVLAQDTLVYKSGKTELVQIIKLDEPNEVVTYRKLPPNDTAITHMALLNQFASIHYANGKIVVVTLEEEHPKTKRSGEYFESLDYVPGEHLFEFYPLALLQLGHGISGAYPLFVRSNSEIRTGWRYQPSKKNMGFSIPLSVGLGWNRNLLANMDDTLESSIYSIGIHSESRLVFESGFTLNFSHQPTARLWLFHGPGVTIGVSKVVDIRFIQNRNTMWPYTALYDVHDHYFAHAYAFYQGGLMLNCTSWLSLSISADIGLTNKFPYYDYYLRRQQSNLFAYYLRLGLC